VPDHAGDSMIPEAQRCYRHEKDWGGKANQELLDPYVWHIVNLTIFGKHANRKAENKNTP
jgi:hypothetical protein